MNVGAYLDRIGYSGPVTITPETLSALQLRHLESVPFENLDIARSRKIVLDTDAFVRKVVEERRGGFCYELNGAFTALLRAIGFRVTLLSARVPRKDGSEGPEFDHLTLRVDLNEPWLADVGFGDSFLQPLLLRTGIEQKQAEGIFRIVDAGTSLKVERQRSGGGWNAEYVFTQAPRELAEFAGMCHYHQTSPESHFTQKRICSRATANGRITLADWNLIVTEGGKREERMLSSEEEWHAALKQHFGIVL
jgi:N-hydroxyarylamine O-acetyltransferase